MANPLAPVTLTADTVETFTLDTDYSRVEVLNADGTAEVFFTVDGADPTVDGPGCQYLPAAIGALVIWPPPHRRIRGHREPSTVRAISSGTPKVVVRGVTGGP